MTKCMQFFVYLFIFCYDGSITPKKMGSGYDRVSLKVTFKDLPAHETIDEDLNKKLGLIKTLRTDHLFLIDENNKLRSLTVLKLVSNFTILKI